jgi:hypothetical protein
VLHCRFCKHNDLLAVIGAPPSSFSFGTWTFPFRLALSSRRRMLTSFSHTHFPLLSDYAFVFFFPQSLYSTYGLRGMISCFLFGEQTTWLLPILCPQPTITHIALRGWPARTLTDERDGDLEVAPWEEHWFPNLQELTMAVQSGRSILDDRREMERLRCLASFLKRRGNWGTGKLERLTFTNGYGATNFPYELFNGLTTGNVDAMLPWTII